MPNPSNDWGYFRRPVLLGPAVGFLAFLASEALKATGPSSTDGLIAFPVVLVLATVFGAIPCLAGGVLLIVACRALPNSLVGHVFSRLVLGGVIGALISLPFGWLLNSMIPSAGAEPRFAFGSLMAGCAAAGAYCAAFLREHRSGAASNQTQ